MKQQKFDLAVIGGGPAGYSAALRAGQLGAATVLIKKSRIGGTCLNSGCVPTKTLLHGSAIFQKILSADHFGIDVGRPTVNFSRMMDRKNEVIAYLRGGVSSLLQNRGVTIIEGEGRLLGEGAIGILHEGKDIPGISAEKVIIAGGAETAVPSIDGLEDYNLPSVVTSTEALDLTELPKKIIILGGGYIGLEFAALFHALGVQVTVLESLQTLLTGMDEEVCTYYEELICQKGIEVYKKVKLKSFSETKQGCGLEFEEASGVSLNREADLLLVAVGRRPAVAFLSESGVHVENGKVVVNNELKTNLPGTYACGDIIGGKMLAHVAFCEGRLAAENALGGRTRMDYKVVPSCLFGSPEVGSVGITEQEARNNNIQVKTARFPFSFNGKALASGETEGFVKIISEPKYGEILGVHIVGPKASELIAEAALAIKLEATVSELASTIHAHPTLSESLMEASLSLLGMPFHSDH